MEPKAMQIEVRSYDESSFIFACFRLVLKRRLGRDLSKDRDVKTVKAFIYKTEGV